MPTEHFAEDDPQSPKKRRGEYVSIATKYDKGNREMLVEPLDWVMIEKLPDEGTNIAGLYQIGDTVTELVKEFNHKELTSSIVSSRLRVLHQVGLVRRVKMAGGGRAKGNWAWQKTVKGKEELEKWQQTQQ